MKRTLAAFSCISILFSALFIPISADTEEITAVWIEDSFEIAVYEGTTRDYMYSISYNGVDSEGVPIGENVYLLMVNGGFIPNPGLMLEEDRALAPVETICEALSMEMVWNAEEQTVSLYNDTTSVTLTIGEEQALVNGETEPMDVAAEIIDSEIYVPVRFIAEAANAEVQYIPNINELSKAGGDPYTGHKDDYVQYVKTIVIETNPDEDAVYSVEDGLEAIKLASEEEYLQVKDFLESQGGGFDDQYNKDYDPDAIEYTNFDMGRYYVYQLEGFPNYPIFYNKYTGVIFSRHAGLPSVWVTEGFIDISWLYQ